MKVRCPFCRSVFTPQSRPQCPVCGKNVLMPGFYGPGGDSTHADTRTHGAHPFPRREPRSSVVPRILRRPFSLFVSVAILLCVGLALVRQTKHPPKDSVALEQLARDNLATLRTAMNRLQRDCSRLPSLRDGLVSLIHDPGLPGWRGPYILTLKPDPWRHPFACRDNGHGWVLFSLGPDGIPDTSDDIYPISQGAPGFDTGKTLVVPVNLPDNGAHSKFHDTVYHP